MPLPQPYQNESKEAFVSRCMSNPTLQTEFPTQEQRLAVCHAQWEAAQQKPAQAGPNNMLILTPQKIQLQAQAQSSDKPVPVRIVAYSGGQIRVPGWGSVVIDLAGLDLPARVPLLADHSERVDATAGWGEPRIVENQLWVFGKLSRSAPAGRRVIGLLSDGIPLQASMGVEPVRTERLRPSEEASVNGQIIKAQSHGLILVKAARLREVSILPIGADTTTTVTVTAKGSSTMPDNNPIDTDMLQAERERMLEIETIFDNLPLEGPAQEKSCQLRAQAVREGWTVDRARAEALELLRTSRAKSVTPVRGRSTARPNGLLTAAALRLLGHEKLAENDLGAEALNHIEQMGINSCLDLCRAACELHLGYVPTGRDAMIRAAFSTNELTEALGAAADKVALDAYRQAPSTWQSFAQVVSAANFREHTGIRLAAAVQLEAVPPDGELKHGTLNEETATFKVVTYGKMVGMNRVAVINDDLGLLAQIPAAFGRAAARKVSDLVYGVLMANADNFFSAGHGNLLTGANSALSIDSLAQAIQALRNQTDADGMPLDLVPRVLLVPPALEATARQVLNSAELHREGTDQTPTGNPFANLNLTLEVEPRLENSNFSGYSTTAWYLLCGPADGAFLAAFLNGRRGPTIEQSQADFNTLGVQYRCWIDAGAAQGDYRAAVKANGA